jgi:hypothetical protein
VPHLKVVLVTAAIVVAVLVVLKSTGLEPRLDLRALSK